jgi:aspartate carbamoyltransferase catalytic subunit
MPESLGDTLRTLSGMVDVVVARPGIALERSFVAKHSVAPLINGGDEGSVSEHPSQALIDLFAIQDVGSIRELSIAICGDLRMRSVRSLLKLLATRLPRRLVLVTSELFADPPSLPGALQPVTEFRTIHELSDVDILYVTGMRHKSLSEHERSLLRVDADCMRSLPSHAVVLSPLPILDEIDPIARMDPRIRMFAQSDQGVTVRMALLEELIYGSAAPDNRHS